MNSSIEGGRGRGSGKFSLGETFRRISNVVVTKMGGLTGNTEAISRENTFAKNTEARLKLISELQKHEDFVLADLFTVDDILARTIKNTDETLATTVAILNQGNEIMKEGKKPDWKALADTWVAQNKSNKNDGTALA